ncbi:hypothetical protein [Isoptericola sp. QY 916]|uniref:hypothetical protein n=1 Tax=Isoptericola sp. QY 916 TaxID=2782570 RepID=UPI003D2FA0C0|nr:hypothetical protein [Isoptericola sp. QY 916]
MSKRSGGSRPEDNVPDLPAGAPRSGWYAYAPLSGAVFVPRADAGPWPDSPLPSPPASPEDLVTVRLMNDYGADWPLWPKHALELPAAVEESVGEALGARLRAWAATFDRHYHYLHGWDDRGVAAAHRAEGESLRDALAAVLPEPWRVELDYWETNGA